MKPADFLCPECGSAKAASYMEVDRIGPPDRTLPWSGVLWMATCAECGYCIPAHLAERWGGLSVEEARREWREIFREWPDARRKW